MRSVCVCVCFRAALFIIIDEIKISFTERKKKKKRSNLIVLSAFLKFFTSLSVFVFDLTLRTFLLRFGHFNFGEFVSSCSLFTVYSVSLTIYYYLKFDRISKICVFVQPFLFCRHLTSLSICRLVCALNLLKISRREIQFETRKISTLFIYCQLENEIQINILCRFVPDYAIDSPSSNGFNWKYLHQQVGFNRNNSKSRPWYI